MPIQSCIAWGYAVLFCSVTQYHGHLFGRREYISRTNILKRTSTDLKRMRTSEYKGLLVPMVLFLQGLHAVICYIVDGRGLHTLSH